jgi:hypothetical protein
MRETAPDFEWVGLSPGPAGADGVELGGRLVRLAEAAMALAYSKLAGLKSHKPLDLAAAGPVLVSFESRPCLVRLLVQDGRGGMVELLRHGSADLDAQPAVAEFVAAGLSRLSGADADPVYRRWRSGEISITVDPGAGLVAYVATAPNGRLSELLFGLAARQPAASEQACA